MMPAGEERCGYCGVVTPDDDLHWKWIKAIHDWLKRPGGYDGTWSSYHDLATSLLVLQMAPKPRDMVASWTPGAQDPVGNPLRLCRAMADCPYPCQMTYPHLHSIIDPAARKADER